MATGNGPRTCRSIAGQIHVTCAKTRFNKNANCDLKAYEWKIARMWFEVGWDLLSQCSAKLKRVLAIKSFPQFFNYFILCQLGERTYPFQKQAIKKPR
jgi:hypothetical protein